MPLSIWKFTLEVTDRQSVFIPKGAQLLTVQTQHEKPCLWALVNPETPTERYEIIIVGTGHPVTADGLYLGTFQLDNGAFVGHTFLAP